MTVPEGKDVPLPCPFCGRMPVVTEEAHDEGGWMVHCPIGFRDPIDSRCGVAPYTGATTREAAVAAWNRRAPASVPVVSEDMIDAGIRAFVECTGFWAPEQLGMRDCQEKMIEEILTAALYRKETEPRE